MNKERAFIEQLAKKHNIKIDDNAKTITNKSGSTESHIFAFLKDLKKNRLNKQKERNLL